MQIIKRKICNLYPELLCHCGLYLGPGEKVFGTKHSPSYIGVDSGIFVDLLQAGVACLSFSFGGTAEGILSAADVAVLLQLPGSLIKRGTAM